MPASDGGASPEHPSGVNAKTCRQVRRRRRSKLGEIRERSETLLCSGRREDEGEGDTVCLINSISPSLEEQTCGLVDTEGTAA